MPEDIPTAQASETPVSAVAQGETPITPATDETSGTNHEDPIKELESLKKALAKANAEAASHRHKAKELDELKARIEAEKLSETDRLQKQYADLQRIHDDFQRASQERTITYEVKLRAAQAGIVDPDAAAKLLDWSQLEFDDAGSPSNVSELLGQLLKNKPYLAGKTAAPSLTSSGNATNPSRSQSQAPATLSWDAISKMTPEQYNARRAEIQTWMVANPPRFR